MRAICSCRGRSNCYDSRPSDKSIWRRRVCKSCGKRWSTFEIGMEEFELFMETQRLVNRLKVIMDEKKKYMTVIELPKKEGYR